MEESKSVPGARKVRKQSSGGRSGRSSRKSSLSSVASLTDSELPDAPELVGSENIEAPKKIIPNGTHSDEDRIIEQSKKKDIDVAHAEGSKDKGAEAGNDGTSDKLQEDKNLKNANLKTENINILNINPEQGNESTESSNKGKIPDEVKTVGRSEAETLFNEKSKELKSKDVCENTADKEDLVTSNKEKTTKKKIVNKIKVSDSVTKIKDLESVNDQSAKDRGTIELKDKNKIRKVSVDDKKGNVKTENSKIESEEISVKENFSVNNSGKQQDKLAENKLSLIKKDDSSLVNKNKKNESCSSKEQFKKVGDKSFVSVVDNEEIKLEDTSKESNSEAESSDANRLKSEDDSSEDGSSKKLDFVGFETPSNEKSTMFFRILDDIRIDDSVMEEMADGEGDTESEKRDEVNKDDILSTTSSTPSLSSIKSSGSVPRKRPRDRSIKKPPLDLSHPQYLKPFEYGWKRELVFRSVSETGTSKRNADIYYYTPKGKKVRSTREVVENLTDPELTIDNFTFFKEPIGINDPEKEIIREAKIRGDRDLSATPPPAKKIALPKILKLGDVKSPKPSPLAIDVPMKDVDQNEVKKSDELSPPKATGFSLTPKIVLKSIKVSNKGKPPAKPLFTHPAKSSISKDKRRQDSEDELEMGMLPPLWPTPPEKGTAREILPSTKVTGSSKTIEVCSIRCPLAMGLIPTLQCHLCLCLYHPECVGLEEAINRTIHSYVCKNCQEAKKGGGISGTVLNKVTPPVLTSPPPLTPISTLGANSNAGPSSSATPPKLQRLTDAKLPTTSKSQKIVGGVTTWLPPSSMIQLTSKNTSSKTSVPAVATVETASSLGSMPAQTLMSMNGKRYVVVPKHNVLSVSPAITTSGLSVTDPQSPSTFVSSSSPTVETTVSSSNASSSNVTTSNPPSTMTSVSVNCNAIPASSNSSSNKNSSNSLVLSKLPVPSDPSRSYAMNNPTTPTNPPGVLLVPCVATANNTKEGSKFLIVNGPSGLPSGNFVIGNIPPQQQLQLPAVPTTQPAVPSNETGGGVKRLNEDNDKIPPAKRPKKETPPKKESTSSSSSASTPKAANTASPSNAATPLQSNSVAVVHPVSSLHRDYYIMNTSAIYKALLHSFQYLKVQELLRASRVCHLWKDIAHHKSLWQTVRMKNSKVRDWEGFASMLRNSGTKHLDLRKMLVPDKQESHGDMWTEYSRAMENVNMLLRIDMCRCPTSAVENSVKNNKDLRVLSALALRNNPLNMAAFESCKNLTELRLKSSEKGGLEVKNLPALKNLTKMKHLSLTTVKNLPPELTEVFENLINLESVELGECSHLPESVATEGLSKLTKLQRLRLEKGQEPTCPTIALLNTVSKLTSLVQLELINFDIKPGFDSALANCTNLRTLLIIPTYVTQSATTNHVVMEGVSKLSKTLMHFVWGITLELLRVTDLFIDQWEGQKSPKSTSASTPTGALKKGGGDSIPILKPSNEDGSKDGSGTPSQVDILQLPKLHKVLTALLPTTKIKILKVPFSATWRQTVTGPTSTQ